MKKFLKSILLLSVKDYCKVKDKKFYYQYPSGYKLTVKSTPDPAVQNGIGYVIIKGKYLGWCKIDYKKLRKTK